MTPQHNYELEFAGLDAPAQPLVGKYAARPMQPLLRQEIQYLLRLSHCFGQGGQRNDRNTFGRTWVHHK